MRDIWNALNDGTRRKIVKILNEKEMTAGEIADNFKTTKATISHHLSILKEADLIIARKEGQKIFYSLHMTVFQQFFKSVLEIINKEN